MNKQIIITGGLGFIGQHLVKELIDEGYFPIIVDDLSNGNKSFLKSIDKTLFHLIKCDITNKKKLEKYLITFSPNSIIHLAALHFIPECDKEPEQTIKINSLGTQILLEIAANKNIKNFLFASSAAVYKPSTHPHSEKDSVEPTDIYGQSKMLAEKIIEYYGRKTNIKFTILRFFNVYGPKDSTPHFIPSILSRIKKTHKIKVGNLNTSRDYIYVKDVTNAIIKILKSQDGFSNSIYNIGSGKTYSGLSLIKIISKTLGKKIDIYKDKKLTRETDRKVLRADITKFSEKFSWKPKYTIRDGINKLSNSDK